MAQRRRNPPKRGPNGARSVPHRPRAQDTLDVILAAASRLLAEQGWEATTTTGIARRAGVSVGSVYHYFADKEALAAALVRRRVDEFERVLIDAANATHGAPLVERVCTMVEAIANAKASDAALHEVLLPQLAAIDALHAIDAMKSRIHELLSGILVAEGFDPPRADRRAFVVVYAVEAVFTAALDRHDEGLSSQLIDEVKGLLVPYLTP